MVHMHEWRNMTSNVGQNYLINSTGFTSNCPNTDATAIIGDLLGAGMTIATMAMMAKQNGGTAGVKQANSAISQQAQATIASYTSDMTTAMNNFTNKYSDFDVSITKEGVPSKSFAQIKGELDTRAKTLQASVDTEKKDCLTKYNNQKAVVIAVESAITNYSNIETQLNALNDPTKITVNGDEATAVKPDAESYRQYLPNKEGDPTTTQEYKDAEAANKRAADDYNKLADNQKAILSKHGVQSLDELKNKKNEEQKELDRLGEASINGSMDVATYVDALNTVNSQIIKLGTEADFNNAVNEIKDLHTDYTNALDIQAQEKRVTGQNNAMKNAKADLKAAKRGGKKGLRGWIHDITHKDKKDANVVAQKGVYNTEKQKVTTQNQIMQNLYEQFYPDT